MFNFDNVYFIISSQLADYNISQIIRLLFKMLEGDDNREEQIRKHHEKWKKWKIELKMKDQAKKKQITEKKTILGKPQDNAREYALRLIEKLQQPEVKCPISKNVAEELQTNTCTICFQLMAPPSNPYILFPCGHNICKICLFVNGDKKQQRYALKLQKCPLCRVKISNYAQNRNLMKLICSYMNNKDLLQKYLENQAQQKQQIDTIAKLSQHCTLLQNEKKVLHGQLFQYKKNKKVMEEVIERLLDQRRRCKKQLDAVQQQARLINRHMNEKQQEMDNIDYKIILLQQKQSKIESTLAPLKAQKQKIEIQTAKKLIQGK